MELLKTSEEMRVKMAKADDLIALLPSLSEEWAKKETNYKRELAKTIVGLRNGKTYHIEQIEISGIPTTVMQKVAEGICWKEQLEMDVSERTYKNTLESIRSNASNLNAVQSINRHLSES